MKTIAWLTSFVLFFSLYFTSVAIHSAEPSRDEQLLQLAKEMAGAEGNVEVMKENLTIVLKVVEDIVGSPISIQLALLIGECSDSAAHPDDPGKIGKGISFQKIIASSAIETCKSAHQNGGSEIGLVLVSLSRAYNKAESYSESLIYAKKAVEAGYPFGDVIMANHYVYGDGVEKNDREQFRWFKKAATKGVTSAMRVTAENYRLGKGTKVNNDEAYFWSTQAIENIDAKGFYQLAKVLEQKAIAHPDGLKILSLAKQSYEIAGENLIKIGNDISRINQQLYPNTIADDKVLNFPTITGRKIDGVFFPTETSSNWYIGEKALKSDDSTYLYARTSYNSTILTLWYKQSAAPNHSGWYVDFLFTGNNQIAEFHAITVVSNKASKGSLVDLDLSDPQVQKLAYGYRLTGRITYRDVQVLLEGNDVKLYYQTVDNLTPTYTMALNNTEINAGVNKNQSAKIVVTQLTQSVLALDKNCCEGPQIIPLGMQYEAIYSSCYNQLNSQLSQQKKIRQDCHILLKNAKYSNKEFILSPLETYLVQLLKEIDRVMIEG